MSHTKMHADEVDTDAGLVRRLLQAQFSQYAGLPISRVASSGTDHAIYRVGEDLSARLPRREVVVYQLHGELEWFPKLAPHLPLAIPVPLAKGEPGEGYPFPWLLSPWMHGEDATAEHLRDLSEAAVDLARFILALQRIDGTGAPPPGRIGRGLPLATRDQYTRNAIARAAAFVDVPAVTAAWEAALATPAWDRDPVWVHGDLLPGNLLARDGRLSAVIDWCPGAGDPAVELMVAWTLFEGESREAFRAALDLDDATWARGRGWALSTALVALPYYINTNRGVVARARRQIDEVLADWAREGD